MPKELIKEDVDLDCLQPAFRDTVLQLLANCKARGKEYLLNEGFRTWGRSHQLYQAMLNGGPRAAPAGSSAHNYGMAADLVFIKQPSPKRVLSWEPRHYDVLVEEAKKLGLHCGMKNDLCHVGVKGFETTLKLQPLAAVWNRNRQLDTLARLRKVWEEADRIQSSERGVLLS